MLGFSLSGPTQPSLGFGILSPRHASSPLTAVHEGLLTPRLCYEGKFDHVHGHRWLVVAITRSTVRALEVDGTFTGCSAMGFEVLQSQWAARALSACVCSLTLAV